MDHSSRKRHGFQRRHQIKDEARMILLLLKEHPQPISQIRKKLLRLAMQFGDAAFLDIEIPRSQLQREYLKIENQIPELIKTGMIVEDEKGFLNLTKEGEEAADFYSTGILSFLNRVNQLMSPSFPPAFSLIIHIFLGIIKLISGLVTGSVALLGDALDSVLDGVSAISVGIAIRLNKERVVTYVLVFLMLLTGTGIMLDGFHRLLFPAPLEEELLAILVVFLSIVILVPFYVYQKYVGYQSKNLAILAQAEDSKNHIYNAGLVLIAIITSILGRTTGLIFFYYIDGIAGCIIGFLIVRAAYGIFIDLIRSRHEEETIDYEKYKLGAWKGFDKYRDRVLDMYILHKVANGSKSYKDILSDFEEDFHPIIINATNGKKEFPSYHTKESLERQYRNLLNSGSLEKDKNQLRLTEKGRGQLNQEIKKRKKHHGGPWEIEFNLWNWITGHRRRD